MEVVKEIEAKIGINELELVETIVLTGDIKMINAISITQVFMHNVLCNSSIDDEEAEFYATEFNRMIRSSMSMRNEE